MSEEPLQTPPPRARQCPTWHPPSHTYTYIPPHTQARQGKQVATRPPLHENRLRGLRYGTTGYEASARVRRCQPTCNPQDKQDPIQAFAGVIFSTKVIRTFQVVPSPLAATGRSCPPPAQTPPPSTSPQRGSKSAFSIFLMHTTRCWIQASASTNRGTGNGNLKLPGAPVDDSESVESEADGLSYHSTLVAT